jgi:hypothetical protein
MTWSVDARIPVTLVAEGAALPALLAGGPASALLVEARPDLVGPEGAVTVASFDAAAAPHAAACACCAGQTPVATALDRLFQARVRGACPWFERVVVLVQTPAARDQVTQALAGDRLAQARFRMTA